MTDAETRGLFYKHFPDNKRAMVALYIICLALRFTLGLLLCLYDWFAYNVILCVLFGFMAMHQLWYKSQGSPRYWNKGWWGWTLVFTAFFAFLFLVIHLSIGVPALRILAGVFIILQPVIGVYNWCFNPSHGLNHK